MLEKRNTKLKGSSRSRSEAVVEAQPSQMGASARQTCKEKYGDQIDAGQPSDLAVLYLSDKTTDGIDELLPGTG